MSEIETLKAELAAAKVEIINLNIRLTNLDFLYRQELKKPKKEEARFRKVMLN